MEANRKNINAAFAKMQQEAKQLGVELLTKPEVFIDDDHLCCVWYGGYIGGFMYKDYTVALEVHGDVVICGVVDGKDFEYTNRLNNGAMSMAASDHLRTAFKSDAELDKAIEDERIEYTANNWIEVFVQGPNGDWSEGNGRGRNRQCAGRLRRYPGMGQVVREGIHGSVGRDRPRYYAVPPHGSRKGRWSL